MTNPYRVIVVEDDLDVAEYTKTILENKLGCTVRTFTDPTAVRAALADFAPDVIITDIEMPGMSGLDLIEQVREVFPGMPVIVMTAHASIEYAVSALRNQANEFLTKPVSSADLVAHVERLAEDARASASAAPGRAVVLAIGAHPDDVEIGVGGTLAAHRDAGDPVTILTLSRGARDGGIKTAWEEGSASAQVIGARLLMEDVPEHDVRQDFAVDAISKAIAQVNPTIVYVHSNHDRHEDHRTVFDAAMVAAGNVNSIVCYQGSTATVDFKPNRFVSIDAFLDTKVAMLNCFAVRGDRPRFLEPDFVRATARYWSRFSQSAFCEPFEIIRESAEVK
ncbi:MAG: response regulator [Cryobacterium sp.]|nr:response regulator [Cryobacterium sp.]